MVQEFSKIILDVGGFTGSYRIKTPPALIDIPIVRGVSTCFITL